MRIVSRYAMCIHAKTKLHITYHVPITEYIFHQCSLLLYFLFRVTWRIYQPPAHPSVTHPKTQWNVYSAYSIGIMTLFLFFLFSTVYTYSTIFTKYFSQHSEHIRHLFLHKMQMIILAFSTKSKGNFFSFFPSCVAREINSLHVNYRSRA